IIKTRMEQDSHLYLDHRSLAIDSIRAHRSAAIQKGRCRSTSKPELSWKRGSEAQNIRFKIRLICQVFGRKKMGPAILSCCVKNGGFVESQQKYTKKSFFLLPSHRLHRSVLQFHVVLRLLPYEAPVHRCEPNEPATTFQKQHAKKIKARSHAYTHL